MNNINKNMLATLNTRKSLDKILQGNELLLPLLEFNLNDSNSTVRQKHKEHKVYSYVNV